MMIGNTDFLRYIGYCSTKCKVLCIQLTTTSSTLEIKKMDLRLMVEMVE